MTNPKFTKYQEEGPYHWTKSHPNNFHNLRKFDPRLSARYSIVLSHLRKFDLLRSNQIGLDLGCGDGVMPYRIAKMGGKCWGIDGKITAIEQAKIESLKRGVQINVMTGNVYDIKFDLDFFSYVISLDVIEHLEKTDLFLNGIKRCLRPSGIAIFTTPMELSPGEVQDKFHVREYTLETLEELLVPFFSCVNVIGYNPRSLNDFYFSNNKGTLNKLGSWAIKLAGAYFWNPLERLEGKESSKYSDIIAICKK